jgi:hypothetical protein
MSEREDRLRSLLNKVRAKRPEERITRAGDAVERMRTASGTTAAAAASAAPSVPPQAQPTPVPSAFPTQAAPEPLPDPPTTPSIESPTRYSSQPPRVERLSSSPSARIGRASSGSMPAASSSRPEAIRPQSMSPGAQSFIVSSDPPEFPRPSTFGELLELTLSLRPR